MSAGVPAPTTKTAADRIADAIKIGNLTVRDRLLFIAGLLAFIAAAGALFWLIRKRQ